MPATPPAFHESRPAPSHSDHAPSDNNTPFTIGYDKLVIAVGAYSQSISFLFCLVKTVINRNHTSVQCSRSKGVCSFSQGRQGCQGYPFSNTWMFAHSNVNFLHSQRNTGFEQANQPTISDADRRKLLNFCVVGKEEFSDILWGVLTLWQGVDRQGLNSQQNCTIYCTGKCGNIIRH